MTMTMTEVKHHPIILKPFFLTARLLFVVGKHPEYEVGDFIYGQEPWAEDTPSAARDYCLKSRVGHRYEHLQPSEWEPAETMPAIAAFYWANVTAIECDRASDFSFDYYRRAKILEDVGKQRTLHDALNLRQTLKMMWMMRYLTPWDEDMILTCLHVRATPNPLNPLIHGASNRHKYEGQIFYA